MNKSIVLYSTGCPACKTLKMMLEQAGIEYTENNNQEEMISLGFTQIPMLSIDGIHMSYKEAKAWVTSNSKGVVNEK